MSHDNNVSRGIMARSQTKKEKGKELNRRLEIIKSMMSSFVVGTVAIVAAVIFIPASPKAEIIKTKALTDTITYQVNVTDEDSALDLSTLVVAIENQFEYYETPIGLGEHSGYFDQLTPDTKYWLNVYGSKGFGLEKLDSVIIRTRAEVGGMILSVAPIPSDFDVSYMVDVLISDPDQLYQSVTLYYGYSLEWEPDLPIQYQSVDIVYNRSQIELTQIYTSEAFHIYLEANTQNGPIILDDIWVTPPFELYSLMYIDRINDDAIYVVIYDDMNETIDTSYQLDVYIGEFLIKSVDVVMSETFYNENVVEIKGLSPGHTYRIEGVATYQNPLTLREEQIIIMNETITTLEPYDIDYQITRNGSYLEVTITARDPNHYFQIPVYVLYEITDDQPIWIESMSYDFTPSGDQKTVSFQINIPPDGTYRVVISIENQLDSTIRHIVYDDIIE